MEPLYAEAGCISIPSNWHSSGAAAHKQFSFATRRSSASVTYQSWPALPLALSFSSRPEESRNPKDTRRCAHPPPHSSTRYILSHIRIFDFVAKFLRSSSAVHNCQQHCVDFNIHLAVIAGFGSGSGECTTIAAASP